MFMAPVGVLADPTETVLHFFSGQPSDGAVPFSSLIADSAGHLYGTTYAGGATNYGTVFELSPPASAGAAWTATVLYSFTGGSDGFYPLAGLIFDSNGNLYGTTSSSPSGVGPPFGLGFGGELNCVSANPASCGTVFKLSPPAAGGAWTETQLLYFSNIGTANPAAALFADSMGNLYGTTGNILVQGRLYTWSGVVFELSPPAAAGGRS